MQYGRLHLQDSQNIEDFDIMLFKAIYSFSAGYNRNPYIVCSTETLKEIQKYLAEKYKAYMCNSGGNFLGSYKGYNILINDTLPFGEVEIKGVKNEFKRSN